MENKEDGEKLENLVIELYNEISARKGIAQELIKAGELKEIKKRVINKLKTKLLVRIEEALDCHKEYKNVEIAQDNKKRLVKLVFIEIIAMNNEFHDDKQKNIDFIMNSVNSILC